MKKQTRFIFHPVIAKGGNRNVFILFVVFSILVGVLMWWGLESALDKAALNLPYGPLTTNTLLSILLSPHFRLAMIFISALVAGALTGARVTGPVKRMEQWLKDYEAGQLMTPLRVREKDKFADLVDRINNLFGTQIK